MKFNTTNTSTIPQPANWVLTKLLKNKMSDEQVGDLFEEYSAKASNNPNTANKWIARQTIIACLSAINSTIRSEQTLGYALYLIAIGLFTSLTLFISWLSNADDIASNLWQTLLAGKVHSLLAEPGIWASMFETANNMDFGMYIHIPSLAWAGLCFFGLSYIQKKQLVSQLTFTSLAVAAVTLPYLWSLAYIATHELKATQIGPIIAFGVISAFYLILPVTHKVVKAAQGKSTII